MTDMNHTHITLVLDRSGSMSNIWDDTLGGINTFIDEQKKLPGKVTFTLHWFDDKHEWPYDAADLASVKKITREDVQPRGMTALNDAIGSEIDRTGTKLGALPEAQRPGKVLFVIMTDGGENASCILEDGPSTTVHQHGVVAHGFGILNPQMQSIPRHLKYATDKLSKMIERQQKDYQWQFVFMGANQDAYAVASSMNIGAGQTVTYASNSAGTARAFASINKVASGYRNWSGAGGQSMGVVSASFDAEDKQWQKDAGATDQK